MILSWLLGGLPAQAKHVSAVVLERHDDVCMGLDEAECCAQKLQIAGFRATGDQLPRATKTPVRLSCSAPAKVFPETSCRLLALARGFNAKEASALCAPGQLAKRCHDDASCKQCVNDLGKLDWKAPHRACAAVTFVEPHVASSRVKVVKVTRRLDGTLVTTTPTGDGIRVQHTDVR